MGCEKKNNNFEELCIKALKAAACRITQPRLSVIRCLASARKPLTASEIYELITLRTNTKKKPVGSADKVSVYRILETLLNLDLIHRVMPSGSYIACTHQNCLKSYHVLSRCRACDKVEEIGVPNNIVAPLLSHLQNNKDFTPDSHLLQMEGKCSSCST